ncbi:MAG TPA: NUDIX hydrolase [Thermoleophilaceae bacterium]|jgi:ADP-ribose pyrophosphatase
MAFERIGGEEAWSGKVIAVQVDRFRYEDGEEAEREYVRQPDAVTILPFDGERLYMVRQPREAVGEQSLLELPAGKLDQEGEGAEQTARRELAEEIGKGAREWRELTSFWISPGFSSERMYLYLATGLYDEQAEADENERIEIVTVPLDALDDTIADAHDSKTLVGLLWFRAYLRDAD